MRRTFIAALLAAAATPVAAAPDYQAQVKADYDRDLGKLFCIWIWINGTVTIYIDFIW